MDFRVHERHLFHQQHSYLKNNKKRLKGSLTLPFSRNKIHFLRQGAEQPEGWTLFFECFTLLPWVYLFWFQKCWKKYCFLLFLRRTLSADITLFRSMQVLSLNLCLCSNLQINILLDCSKERRSSFLHYFQRTTHL